MYRLFVYYWETDVSYGENVEYPVFHAETDKQALAR